MRAALHVLIVLLAMLPLLLAWACLAVGMLGMVLADKLHPTAKRGNCWAFACARWWRMGGYLALRPADSVSVFGVLPVPHVLHVEALGTDARIKHTRPVKRRVMRWLPLRKLYFRFTVADSDPRTP